jgi:hypothetical protein
MLFNIALIKAEMSNKSQVLYLPVGWGLESKFDKIAEPNFRVNYKYASARRPPAISVAQ